jgi:hypothetical protein
MIRRIIVVLPEPGSPMSRALRSSRIAALSADSVSGRDTYRSSSRPRARRGRDLSRMALMYQKLMCGRHISVCAKQHESARRGSDAGQPEVLSRRDCFHRRLARGTVSPSATKEPPDASAGRSLCRRGALSSSSARRLLERFQRDRSDRVSLVRHHASGLAQMVASSSLRSRSPLRGCLRQGLTALP